MSVLRLIAVQIQALDRVLYRDYRYPTHRTQEAVTTALRYYLQTIGYTVVGADVNAC